MERQPTQPERGGLAVAVRARAERYVGRRTPWNAPWWIYVVAIGAVNVARQLLLPDLSTPVQIATFVATVVVVGAVVTLVHRRLSRPRQRS